MATFQLNATPIIGPEVARLSDPAFRLWIGGLAWQARHGEGGRVCGLIAKMYVGRRAKRCIAELVDGGLWQPTDEADWYIAVRELRGFELWRPGPSDRTRPFIDPDLRAAVYGRDGYACLHCGSTENLSLDHIHPFSLGGKDTFENLQTLCRSCNSRKGARI